jgi:2'-5' RNA ligase
MVNHIKLYEIAATAKNFEMFKAKYGKDVSDEQLKNIFDRFNKQQSRLTIKDIFKYASLKDLTSALETKSGKEVEKSIKTSEANILVDNEKMMIVEPLSMAASLKYGANTKWCTTYSDPAENQFNNYFGDYTLVYFIDKIHKSKYAIAYDKNNKKDTEAFDEKDDFIKSSKILKIFNVSLEEISNKTISSEEKKKVLQKNFSKDMQSRIVGDIIKGDVNIGDRHLKKITDIFDFSKYKVVGGFYCWNNQLTSLVGAPVKVGGSFFCMNNQLTSLTGAPKEVGGHFSCENNQLTSLVGAPVKVGGSFYCIKNPTKFSKEDIQKAMKGDVSEIFIQKENNMDKIPAYYSFYTDLITEGHCIMADVPQKESMLEFIKKIPNECVYEEVGENYGKETNPHVTVMYGLSPVEETRVKELLTKVPKKIVAELGKISKFSNTDTPYDVLKIEVKSPHLSKIHEIIRKNFENNYKWPQYNPHVTLAYVKKGTCNEYVGNKTFEGMKVMFETFMYSNGIRELNHAVPMKEYNVGTSGGYGGGAMAGGGVAANNWAGTFSSNQTSRRLNDYPASRRYTYMQGNTVIGSSLYDTITQDDLKHPTFSEDEIMTGLRKEMSRMEFPDKDVAKQTVLTNLEQKQNFYSGLHMYSDSATQGNNIMEKNDIKPTDYETQLAMGIEVERDHHKDKPELCKAEDDHAFAKLIAQHHLKDDENYYKKLKAAGISPKVKEGALTPFEAGMGESDDMEGVGAVMPVAPNVAVIKITGPIDAGQTSLSSSGMGRGGTPRILKTSSIEAPAEKNKVGPNKVVVSKTPTIGGTSCDPMDHFGAQMNKGW